MVSGCGCAEDVMGFLYMYMLTAELQPRMVWDAVVVAPSVTVLHVFLAGGAAASFPLEHYSATSFKMGY